MNRKVLGNAAIVMLGVAFAGCARTPADDWHHFVLDIAPAQQELKTATDGWRQIYQITGSNRDSRTVYGQVLSLVDTTVIPAQGRALTALQSVHARTPEVQAVESRYRDGVQQMQEGAKLLHDATGQIQKGDTAGGASNLKKGMDAMNQGRTTMREAAALGNALNQKYGPPVVDKP